MARAGKDGNRQPVFYSRNSSKSVLPAEPVTEYKAIGGAERSSSLTALVAIAMISGIANGYNGFVLEGADFLI